MMFPSFFQTTQYGKFTKEILDFFVPLALKLPQLRGDPNLMAVTVKAVGISGIQDVATEADKYMQQRLKEKVAKLHSDWQFWGEEGENNISAFDSSKSFLFITDPIEGTNNFRARKDNDWGSVVALVDIKKGDPIIGIVAHPATKTFYVGVKDQGAYLLQYNGENQIFSVNPMSDKPEDERFTYNNSPHFSPELSAIAERFLSLGKEQPISDDASDLEKSRKTVSIDSNTFIDPESGALEVVRNRGTIYFKTSNEMAAAFVILKELGGVITDADGKPWHLGINSLISARNKEDYEYLKSLSDKARGVTK